MGTFTLFSVCLQRNYVSFFREGHPFCCKSCSTLRLTEDLWELMTFTENLHFQQSTPAQTTSQWGENVRSVQHIKACKPFAFREQCGWFSLKDGKRQKKRHTKSFYNPNSDAECSLGSDPRGFTGRRNVSCRQLNSYQTHRQLWHGGLLFTCSAHALQDNYI